MNDVITYDYVNEFLQQVPGPIRDHIVLADGKTISIQASEYHYCSPRSTESDRYDSVEVWGWGEKETFFDEWSPDGDPASFVPVERVNEYIMLHGGIM